MTSDASAQGPSGPTEREAQGPSGPTEREALGPSGPKRGALGPSGPTEREAQGPPWAVVEDAVERALAEDLGLAGDVTTRALVDPDALGRGELRFRTAGVLAGTWVADAVSARFDLLVTWDAAEGERVEAGDVAGDVEGNLADLLVAERTLLNFLCRLSGVATLTRAFVDAVDAAWEAAGRPGNRPRVRDTRKTTPGLRALEKAAVRSGGGANHRMGLFDAVLVKDNHVAALGGDLAAAVALARAHAPAVPIETEADTVAQAAAAAAAGADCVLLDNMSSDDVAAAVAVVAGRCPLEVSGGVTLANVGAYAATGVDYVAVGALTHSAPAVDIGLDLVAE